MEFLVLELLHPGPHWGGSSTRGWPLVCRGVLVDDFLLESLQVDAVLVLFSFARDFLPLLAAHHGIFCVQHKVELVREPPV